jgi:hypothetical protein
MGYSVLGNPEKPWAEEEEQRETFIFEFWFGSVLATNQVKEGIHKDEKCMPAGHECIPVVKQITSYCQIETIGAFVESVATKWILHFTFMPAT